MLYSHTLPAHVIGCYDCTQPGFEEWGSTQAQSLILALFPVMIEDNSDQTSNLVSYRLIFKLTPLSYPYNLCRSAGIQKAETIHFHKEQPNQLRDKNTPKLIFTQPNYDIYINNILNSFFTHRSVCRTHIKVVVA